MSVGEKNSSESTVVFFTLFSGFILLSSQTFYPSSIQYVMRDGTMVPQLIMSSCHVSKPPLVRRVGDNGGRNCGASQVSNWRKQCASSGSISSQLVSSDTVGDVCVVAGGIMASKGPANQLVVGGRRVLLCGQKSRFCEFAPEISSLVSRTSLLITIAQLDRRSIKGIYLLWRRTDTRREPATW